jgi:hypothetical protein
MRRFPVHIKNIDGTQTACTTFQLWSGLTTNIAEAHICPPYSAITRSNLTNPTGFTADIYYNEPSLIDEIYVFLVHCDGFILPSSGVPCCGDTQPKRQGGYQIRAVKLFCPTPTPTPTPTRAVICIFEGGTASVVTGTLPGPTPTSTPPTPTQTSTPPTPTQTASEPAPTPTHTTASEAAICQYTVTGSPYPLSGSGGSNTGLLKVSGNTIYVWAKYNSAGTSSGTASFGMTIGGVSATGQFTITSQGQVGYTNSGGTNNLHYIRLTPGTYEYIINKTDSYSAGNNVGLYYSTGTDSASSIYIGTCLTEPPGPYLSAGGGTSPDPTPTPSASAGQCYTYTVQNTVNQNNYGLRYTDPNIGASQDYKFNMMLAEDGGSSAIFHVCSRVNPTLLDYSSGSGMGVGSIEGVSATGPNGVCSSSIDCATPAITWCYNNNGTTYGPFNSQSECQAASNGAICDQCVA